MLALINYLNEIRIKLHWIARLPVGTAFGMIGAKKVRENSVDIAWKIGCLPIWFVIKTGACVCGSIVDALIVVGRANNVTGLADDRLTFLLFR